MRKLVLLAFAGLSLCGCATPEGVQRQAVFNCQSVGITEKDPQFATCSRAYSLQYVQDRLEQSYYDALNATPEEARVRPRGHGY